MTMKFFLVFFGAIIVPCISQGFYSIFANIFQIVPKYKPSADSIINYLLQGGGKGQAYVRLANFTDKFGPRMVGSTALENSIDWIVEKATKEGFLASTEPVVVPKWVRGYEAATLLLPRSKDIAVLGLGLTGPTPSEGITAEAVVVRSFEELSQLGEAKISGKIVVYNEPWTGYRQAAYYRVNGARRAAEYGAVAALIRSAASHSIYSPHTGAMNTASIPGACIAVEDAEFLQRLQDSGQQIKIWLRIDSKVVGNTIIYQS